MTAFNTILIVASFLSHFELCLEVHNSKYIVSVKHRRKIFSSEFCVVPHSLFTISIPTTWRRGLSWLLQNGQVSHAFRMTVVSTRQNLT